MLAHKDQSYHKRLAQRLQSERKLDSFRYDLRGQGGESEGDWEMASFDNDVAELEVVIEWLKTVMGYKVQVLIG